MKLETSVLTNDPKSEVGDLLQHVQHSAAQPVSVTWMYRPYDAWELL